MTYKPGDRVLVELDVCDAYALNEGIPIGFRVAPKQILEHHPAPEPAVWFVNVYPGRLGNFCHVTLKEAIKHQDADHIATWRIEHTNGKNPVISEVGDE